MKIHSADLQAIEQSDLMNKINDGEISNFIAYGTLRPGDYNFEYYKLGIRSLSQYVHIHGCDLWTHGPYPFLIKDASSPRPVLGELMEFTNSKTAIEILDLEKEAGYDCGLFGNKLIFYWPGSSSELSAFLNHSVKLIETGDWFDYRSPTSF